MSNNILIPLSKRKLGNISSVFEDDREVALKCETNVDEYRINVKYGFLDFSLIINYINN